MSTGNENMPPAPEPPAPEPPPPEPPPPEPPPPDAPVQGAPLPSYWRTWITRAATAVLVLVALLVGIWIGLPGDRHDHAKESTSGAASETVWTCSMHPQIRLPEPGQCPICGMDLIPAGGSDDRGGKDRVVLSDYAKTLAGLRTAAVKRGGAATELRLLGRLEADERRERTITSWIGGRIDRLYVSNTGARIHRGRVIASLYSPEVYSAHQDLLSAKRQVRDLAKALPVAKKASKVALEAARRRLALLGMTDSDLEKMESATTPWRNVKIRSPYSGTVIEQLVSEGAYVQAGTPLFKTAELSKIWVQLDAYEGDLALIRLKQKVTLEVASYPGETFEGEVSFVDPVVDPAMRTARVRVEVPNKKGRLRPGMFAEAVIEAPEWEQVEKPVLVPASAVLFTGRRSVVYVEVKDKSDVAYEPREVQLGPRAGDDYPVISGLSEAERVVVSGAFALDSDLQIRGGQSMMTRDDDLTRDAVRPIEIPDAFEKALEPVAAAYLSVHEALAADDLAGAKKGFTALAARVKKVAPTGSKEARELWQKMAAELSTPLKDGVGSKDIDAARKTFERVSKQVIHLFRRLGNPLDSQVHLAFCPMASGGAGAYWLQRADQIENPYFGSTMYRCGELRGSAPSGQHLGSLQGKDEPGAAAPSSRAVKKAPAKPASKKPASKKPASKKPAAKRSKAPRAAPKPAAKPPAKVDHSHHHHH